MASAATSLSVRTVPFPDGSENIQWDRRDSLFDLHSSGLALIEKLGELKWEDRDIGLKEWLAFTKAFEITFGCYQKP